jgi:hypothetical protein
MTPEAQAELARLEALLSAREGKPGYKRNCEAIRKAIAELQSGELPPQAYPGAAT